MDLHSYKRYIRPLLWLRRLIRRAFLFFIHANGLSEKRKLLYYYRVTFLRWLGFHPKVESEWILQLKDIRIHFNPMFAELIPYKEIFVNHIYERDPAFIPSGPQIIFDVGANIGLYTIQAGRRLEGGMIYAFEPNPNAYSKLVKNIEANHLQNVCLFPYAVGAEPGMAAMVIIEGRTTGGRVTEVKEPNNDWIEVEVVTLDGIVEKYQVPRIDLLKIDVEGHENEVLMGGQKALMVTKRMIMEHHGHEVLVRARKFLADFGFQELLEYRRNVYFVNTRLLGHSR